MKSRSLLTMGWVILITAVVTAAFLTWMVIRAITGMDGAGMKYGVRYPVAKELKGYFGNWPATKKFLECARTENPAVFQSKKLLILTLLENERARDKADARRKVEALKQKWVDANPDRNLESIRIISGYV